MDFCSHCLNPTTPLKAKGKWIAAAAIGMTISLVSLQSFAPPHVYRLAKAVKDTVVTDDDVALNDSAILAYMDELDINFPEIVLRQIHVESGHFQSTICKDNKNLLGIKYIKQKEAIGEKHGHAAYPSYKACLRDYKRLQKYYIQSLVGRYAMDPSYGQKLTDNRNGKR
jgi:hypothetical protein